MNADMLKKRIEILKKINVLSDKCNCQTAIEFQNCSNCKQIAKYGQRLLCLVNKRQASKFLDLDDHAPVKNPMVQLTKQQYLKLKHENKNDKEIAAICNVSPGTIQNWKKAKGIEIERTKRKRYKKNVN
ncbi:helix-turn-helix domain-containing protein [Lysinibacillus sp. NPDC096212]|uniref:helix-turn-helix domain-containing protein n=1 Tax=Lysinibacillus sp. NPDC096212 TaxID=3364135 RepID=UPI00380743A7